MEPPSSPALPPGLFIGTSGWSYPEWAEDFYAGVPRKDWLRHYAGRFNALEIDASFYHQVKRSTYAGWREQTPPEFRFTVKAHRFLTHVRRLDFDAPSLALQRDSAAGLGEKLALVLWQLPAGLHSDLPRLAAFAEKLAAWPGPRHALEFRDASWFTGAVAALLAQHGLALCQSDAPDWPLWQAVTTDRVLVRLHGHTELYRSAYAEAELCAWAKQLRRWHEEGREVHVFFDNTASGHAPRDAMRLAALLA